jgi:hypothetical protein
MKIGFEEKWRLPAEVERGEEHLEAAGSVLLGDRARWRSSWQDDDMTTTDRLLL